MPWRGGYAWTWGLLAASALVSQAYAESLDAALARAYQNNPSLNSQRALVRATDETVPQALAGYRPRVSVTGAAGQQSASTTSRLPGTPGQPASYLTDSGYNTPTSAGATITQTLFNGFQTANRTRQAEAQVLAARASLGVAEQTVLLNAVTAYANLLRDRANVELQRSNILVLEEQLRQTRQRFNVREVTGTDVSQAEASLASGRTQFFAAEAAAEASAATYRQVIGVDPDKLSPAAPVDRYFPASREGTIDLAIRSNPAVSAAEYNVDVAQKQVSIQEGALLPNVNLQGTVQQNYLPLGSVSTMQNFNAYVLGTLTVPIYQGGAEYSQIRQAKETLGQKRLDLTTTRDQVRQNAVQAWAQLADAKKAIESSRAQVTAAEQALNGVREEARLGQRTTFDVLTAQQTLVNARFALVTAERDRIVASYTVLAAVGRLNPQVLHLPVSIYMPQVHYMQVRDAWAGSRTPEGQ